MGPTGDYAHGQEIVQTPNSHELAVKTVVGMKRQVRGSNPLGDAILTLHQDTVDSGITRMNTGRAGTFAFQKVFRPVNPDSCPPCPYGHPVVEEVLSGTRHTEAKNLPESTVS